jgi:hypothetical protein
MKNINSKNKCTKLRIIFVCCYLFSIVDSDDPDSLMHISVI